MGAGSGATPALEGCTERPWSANKGAAGKLLLTEESWHGRCASWARWDWERNRCKTGSSQAVDQPRPESAGYCSHLSLPALVPSQREVPSIKAPPSKARAAWLVKAFRAEFPPGWIGFQKLLFPGEVSLLRVGACQNSLEVRASTLESCWTLS